MKLHHQLILFILISTAIPMVVGLAILAHSEEQITERLLSERKKTAQSLADMANNELREVMERVNNSLGYLEVKGMNQDELTGFLGLVYKQSEKIVQVALLDQDGHEVVHGVFLSDPEKYPEYSGRMSVSNKSHEKFLRSIPFKQALSTSMGNAVVADVYKSLDGNDVLMTFAMPLLVPEDRTKWVVGVEVRLDMLCARLIENARSQNLDLLLVDSQGRTISSSNKGDDLLSSKAADFAVAKFMTGQESGAFFEKEKLTVFSKIKLVNWAVVIEQPKSDALFQIKKARIVTLTATGLSILGLVVLGLGFTRKITGKLSRFADSAKKISGGDLDVSLDIHSSDEIGILAETFNEMVLDLKRSREEIEEWNRQLAQRVEEKTEELQTANKRLLQTSKLAAIGQLGAGVAHEINNPLVGILGNAQLLLSKLQLDEKSKKSLLKIESSAKRCRDVIQNLLKFSEQEAEPEHLPCDLNRIIRDAYSLTEQSMLSHGIEVHWELSDDIQQILGASWQLMNVFINVFSNARTAMMNNSSGSVLTIKTIQSDGQVEVTVHDTGKGIEPDNMERIFEPFFTTKDIWTNTGLGLSVAYRIVADHGGKIEVQSEPGNGTNVCIRFPLP